MTGTVWLAVAVGGAVAAWALATIATVTGFHWLAARRDALITAALDESPIDPWDYELRQLVNDLTD